MMTTVSDDRRLDTQPVPLSESAPPPARSPGAAAGGKEFVVGPVADIPVGTHRIVPVGRHGVGVYNVKGTFYAIANYCPHEGGPLCSGRTRGRSVTDDNAAGGASTVREGEFIYCPWHQWGFELATGTTAVKPEWTIRTYAVKVVDDTVIITG